MRSLETSDQSVSKLLWRELDKSAEEIGRAIANGSPAKMPTLDHASMADYNNVYEPSDDTYLLIDAIKHDLFSGYPSDNGDIDSDDEKQLVNSMALVSYRMETDPSGVSERSQKKLEEHKDFLDQQAVKIRARVQQLKRLEKISNVMEIGTGSGVPITYLSKRLLQEKPGGTAVDKFSVIATDLNALALGFARRTAEENGVVVAASPEDERGENGVGIRELRFLETDLAESLLPDHRGTIDVLLFNPPYVPTEDSEISGNGIAISWAGGRDGRVVVDRALPQIAELLAKPDGVCYMITVDDNRPAELAAVLRDRHGLEMVPLVRRRARNEYLSVQKISWPVDPSPS